MARYTDKQWLGRFFFVCYQFSFTNDFSFIFSFNFQWFLHVTTYRKYKHLPLHKYLLNNVLTFSSYLPSYEWKTDFFAIFVILFISYGLFFLPNFVYNVLNYCSIYWLKIEPLKFINLESVQSHTISSVTLNGSFQLYERPDIWKWNPKERVLGSIWTFDPYIFF